MGLLTINDLQSFSPRNLLRKGSFSSNVLTLTAGTTLAQGLNVAATLVLARIFTPEDFGILALFVAITSFLSVVGSWRYETAIMLPEKHEEAVNIQVLALLILLGMCSLSLVAVTLFRRPIARMLGEDRLAPWLWCVPVSLLVSGLYQVFNYWCARMKQFRRLAIAGVCQSLGTLGSQLGLFAIGFGGPFALVFGWVAGQAFASIILAAQALKENGEFLRRSFDWRSVRSGFFKYRNFPLYAAPYIFVQNAAQQCVILMLRIFANMHVVGLFSMANKAVFLPVSLISSSMQQVFYKKAATELKLGHLEPFVLRLLKLQVALGTPALVFFVFEAKPLFRIILGNAWEEVGTYAALLALIAYMVFLTVWMDRIFDVQGRQNLSLIWQISRDILAVGALTIALRFTGNPILAIGAYAGFDFLCVVIWLLVAFRIANFAVKSLWQVGALFVGIGSVAAALLLAVHAVFDAGQGFVLSVLILIAMEVFVFVKYASASQTL